MKIRIVLVVVLAMFVSLAVHAVEYPFQSESARTFKLKPGNTVELVGVNGNIEISRSSDTSIKVRSVIYYEKQEDIGKVAVSYGDRIKNKEGKGWYKIVPPSNSKKNKSINWKSALFVSVPNNYYVKASTVNGDIKINNLDLSLEVDLKNGDLIAKKIRFLAYDDNEISVVNGETTLDAFSMKKSSDLEITSTNGHVNLKALKPNLWFSANLDITVLNGEIEYSTRYNKIFKPIEGVTKVEIERDIKSSNSIEVKVINGSVGIK